MGSIAPAGAETGSLVRLLAEANELRLVENYEAALALYLQASREMGDNADIAAVIGECYFVLAQSSPRESMGRAAEAITWAEKAIKLRPGDSYLHGVLAQYYYQGYHDTGRAVREYRKALELNPGDLIALTGLAVIYGGQQEVVALDEAIDGLERAASVDPGAPIFHARLADLYREAGRTEDARQEAIRALLGTQPLDRAYAAVILARYPAEATTGESDQAEVLYYADSFVRVGSRQVLLGNLSFPTDDIRSVETWSIRADRNTRWTLGLVLLSSVVIVAWVWSMLALTDRTVSYFLAIAYAWIMLAAVMTQLFTRGKPMYLYKIRLHGTFGSRTVFNSKDEGYVEKISGAINAAITGGKDWTSRRAAAPWWSRWRP